VTNVRDRIVLVTGAAGGIGRHLSFELASRGAIPVLWDLDEQGLAQGLEALDGSTGGRSRGYACDVRDPEAVYTTAERVRAEVGDPDVVVNNAGIVSGARLLDIPDEQILRTFEVNVLSLYWVTKAFLPAMMARNRGHVVTIASAAGLVGVARQTDYSASKHAAVGFDESLRVELRQTSPGVMTTVVCPYYVDTGMFEGVRTRVPSLLPILRQGDVARKIAKAIERDRRFVVLPPFVRLLPVLRIVPTRAFDSVMDLLGVNVSMEAFVGHTDSR
jgi:all-trans-retinol dehydrogenase (NAD+)